MVAGASTALPSLLKRNAWRYLGLHRWQTGLSALGIMLGVMMVVAVDLASSSAQRAFDLSVDSVSGTITHQVIGGAGGVPDEVFTAIRNQLDLRRSAPVVSARVRLAGEELTLLGLDLVSEASLQRQRPGMESQPLAMTALAADALGNPDAVLMTRGLARKLALATGDELALDPPHAGRTLELATLIDSEDDAALLYADISLAQTLLGKTGRLDSIDLVLDTASAQRLADWLPGELVLVETGGRNTALEQMTEAFSINLLAMSLLALLVAALLIYNTVSLSVLERRAGFGVMRSLGVTRSQLTRLILTENAVLGLLASALGVAAGILLGSVLVRLVTRTIDDLYFNLTVTRFMVDPLLLAKGFCWGLGITLLAALAPAWQAGRSQPITLQQQGTEGAAFERHLPLLSALGLAMVLAGGLVLQAGGDLVLGFVCLNLLIFGFCLLVPLALHLSLRLMMHLCGHWLGLGWRLAVRGIQSGLDRTALAVAALTVAVSVTVGVGVMVGSLRESVLLWLDQTLVGDVQLTRLDDGAGIPAGLEASVAGNAAIASFSQDYLMQVESELGPLRLQAHSGDTDAWLFMKSGQAETGANAVLVSEPMAWLYSLQAGDGFVLHAANGDWPVTVAGIFYDYTTGLPLLAMTEEQLLAHWPDAVPRRLSLSLAPDRSIEDTALIDDLRSGAEAFPGTYGVVSNRGIRDITLTIFDRTFAITNVLRLLAIVVAFVGVLSAMIALQLQRLRDYAILRASGMTVGQTARVILQQTAIMGVLAGLLSLPLGVLMSTVLIDVINQRSFGWSMQHILPVSVLGEALLLATLAALLAGIWPALRMAGFRLSLALRQE